MDRHAPRGCRATEAGRAAGQLRHREFSGCRRTHDPGNDVRGVQHREQRKGEVVMPRSIPDEVVPGSHKGNGHATKGNDLLVPPSEVARRVGKLKTLLDKLRPVEEVFGDLKPTKSTESHGSLLEGMKLVNKTKMLIKKWGIP